MLYTKFARQTVNAVRFVDIVQVLVRHGFTDMVYRAGLHRGWPGKLLKGIRLLKTEEEPSTFGSRLRAALVDLGPTFIKLGQVLSTRPDLVGHKIAQELAELQDSVAPISFDVIRPIIERELKQPIEELFASIDPIPVAAASLSQVHQAVLRSGEKVAVKAQRPDIDRLIESDISLMATVAEWIAEHNKDLKFIDPVGIVDEFARSIRRELDFEIEARVALQFAENFKDDPEIIIPKLFIAYSARRVITLEWIDGVPIDDLASYRSRNSDPKKTAGIGCRALCDMIFRHQLFHADPHPGNIWLHYDNRIAFLDLGMAGYLQTSDIKSFADIFLAVLNRNAEQCLDAVIQLTVADEPYNRAPLAHEISDYIAFEVPVIIARGQVVRGLELMVQIMRRHDLELAPRFSLLLKALVTIEKVGHILDPDLDMTPILRPYVEDVVYNRYGAAQLVSEVQAHASGYLKLSRQAPTDLAFLLRQLRSGKLKLHVHHEHLETLAQTIDQSSRRNAVAIVIGALLIGSSLLFASDFPLARLGIIGYTVAGVLGVFLIVSLLWGKGNR